MSAIRFFLLKKLPIGYGAYALSRKAWFAIIFAIGFLGLGLSANAQQISIAALGDSLIHGYGLSPATGFVPELEKQLNGAELDVKVINAGVSGDTTSGGLARLEWTLTPEIDALIVSLGGNDVLRGFDPAFSRANLHEILSVAQDRDLPVLLIGIEAPTNYGADYKTEFDAIYPALATEFGTLFYRNFLGALMSMPDRASALADFMQPDGIHPNSDGVVLIVNDLLPTAIKLVRQVQLSN